MTVEGRATIVVLSYNRRVQLLSTLESLQKLPGNWPIIVVDNGSTDGTAAAVARRFPAIMLIRAQRNLGAAARNIGVAYAHTPYIAFSDDDTQWEPDALERAVDLLDRAPDVGVLSACIHVGPTRRLDPSCQTMAQSPLARDSLPGPQLLGFMAGACVMRTRAFYEVGGYWPPLFIGGEESLMALDMVEHGWRIVYAADVITRHFPSSVRDTTLRERLLIRNAIWVAWMRRPVRAAWRETLLRIRQAHSRRILWPILWQALVGMPRALRRRKVISPAVEKMQLLLDVAAADLSPRGPDHHPA
ncbi:glycosyltransferase [Pollutimonas sp. H1-120]|uniref:glycosyltransferase family 2 protein n=1 Tax=Pollutimonas sp. H1-120 TaxID=3148824 RepID=UPI003B51D885